MYLITAGLAVLAVATSVQVLSTVDEWTEVAVCYRCHLLRISGAPHAVIGENLRLETKVQNISYQLADFQPCGWQTKFDRTTLPRFVAR